MAAKAQIGLVLAGGGVRGAYEVGALSALAPALEARGERPRIIVGTSVGALNGAYLAVIPDTANAATLSAETASARQPTVRLERPVIP
jgi:predicted acylesterase/phospholipase RssA